MSAMMLDNSTRREIISRVLEDYENWEAEKDLILNAK